MRYITRMTTKKKYSLEVYDVQQNDLVALVVDREMAENIKDWLNEIERMRKNGS